MFKVVQYSGVLQRATCRKILGPSPLTGRFTLRAGGEGVSKAKEIGGSARLPV